MNKVSRLIGWAHRGTRFYAVHRVVTPTMGDSISHGEVARWHVSVGTTVARDAPICTIDTDKVSVEVNAIQSGIVTELACQEGDEVEVGSYLYSYNDDLNESNNHKDVSEDVNSSAQDSMASETSTTILDSQNSDDKSTHSDENATTESPVHQNSPIFGARTKLSRMRQTISKNLKATQAEAALLTTFNEVEMTALEALKSRYVPGPDDPPKLGLTSAFLVATAQALQKHPQCNSLLEYPYVISKESVDVCIAVSTDTGLVTPAIYRCETILNNEEASEEAPTSDEKLHFGGLEKWKKAEKLIRKVAETARNGQFSPKMSSGAVMTISNGGGWGSLNSTPIPPPGQTSVLGLHAINTRARGDPLAPTRVMQLALTYDHRLLDGKQAVMFLSDIRKFIHNALEQT